jgi:hypothetical protein
MLAFAARYGHQPLDVLLGRAPTELEVMIFVEALEHWIEAENAPRERGS